MKKYIYLLASMWMAFTLQSCFQDMDAPPFDYPEEKPEPRPEPLFRFAFEDNMLDSGKNGFTAITGGTVTYGTGITGKAYKGANETYAVINTPEAKKSTIENLGSFTLSFWMKTPKELVGATGIFGISNPTGFWGHMDLFLDGFRENGEGYFKMQLGGKWFENVWIDGIFIDEWIHMVFMYDETNSTMTIYRNGQSVVTHVFEGLGRLKFPGAGPMPVGTLQFMTKPSLNGGAAEGWGGYYRGMIDQLALYNMTLPIEEVQTIYTNKE